MDSEPQEFEVDYTADDVETPESGGSFQPHADRRSVPHVREAAAAHRCESL